MKIDFPLSYWTQLFFIANEYGVLLPKFSPRVPLPGIDSPLFSQYWEKARSSTMVDIFRAKRIWDLALEAKAIEGDFIECGSHNGGIGFLLAYLIRHFGLKKKIYLCDSFQGLPEPDPHLDGIFEKGALRASLEKCREFIEQNQLTSIAEILPGWFEESLKNFASDQKFSLIHIDCDLYQSTKTCLEYLYPLAPEGAPIIFDDFNIPSPGERMAAREYLSAHRHETLELGSYSQAYFRKGKKYELGNFQIDDPEGNPISCLEIMENLPYRQFLQEVIRNLQGQTQNLKSLLDQISSP